MWKREFLKGFSTLGLDCYGLDKSDYAKKYVKMQKFFKTILQKIKFQ